MPVRLTVRLWAAAEVPSLHAAGKPAPARHARHVHEVALVEEFDPNFVTDAVLAVAKHPEFSQQSKVAKLFQMSARRFVDPLPRAVRHLNRFIAVLRRGLELR